jgi:hypothetical protein
MAGQLGRAPQHGLRAPSNDLTTPPQQEHPGPRGRAGHTGGYSTPQGEDRIRIDPDPRVPHRWIRFRDDLHAA